MNAFEYGTPNSLGNLVNYRQTKMLVARPVVQRTKGLLKLGRRNLRLVVGLVTEHCFLKYPIQN